MDSRFAGGRTARYGSATNAGVFPPSSPSRSVRTRSASERNEQRPRPSRPAPPRKAVVGVLEAAPRQRRAALLDRGHDLRCVARVERADEATVDRRHRRHVAGAEALGLADLGVLEVRILGGLGGGLVHPPGGPPVARHAPAYA